MALGLAALGVVAYLPALLAFFVKDDLAILPQARLGVGALCRGWPGGFYRPLSEFVLALQYALFGLHPLPYHLVSLAVHGMAVVVCHRLLLQLTRDRDSSAVATATFALHPVHTETVSWISGQMSLWAGLLGLVSLYAFSRGSYSRQWRWAALAPVAFLASVGFYEAAATVPLLCGLMVLVRRRNLPARAWSLGWLGAMGLAAVGYGVSRHLAVGLSTGYYEVTDSLLQPVVNAGYYGYLLLGGSAIGGRILRYRPTEVTGAWTFLEVATPLLLVTLAALAHAVWRRRGHRQAARATPSTWSGALLIAWMAIALLPALMLPERPRRLTYLAVLGFALLVAQLLSAARLRPEGWARRHGATAVLILVLAVTTHRRNYDWHLAGQSEQQVAAAILRADPEGRCAHIGCDIPNLVGDALFFNRHAIQRWLALRHGRAVRLYEPHEFGEATQASTCCLELTDGLRISVRPVPCPIPPSRDRGANWVSTGYR